ncbi:MAG: dihydrolipoyl dehydrogenase [Candidatus Dadabacteria bacterium]|nr:dihydrolipoyl dehydrogenase [Candidatus Dadabacteria bacterium]NIQ15533.1 dihydrolipoyl dehydrogenase [Candidatus Dadabacteria bacterium]
MSEIKTDVVVIGAGPGGYPAAFHCADKGKKVVLIDPEINPGGVCLYRGCIPSKALLHAAKIIHEAEDSKNIGIDYKPPSINVRKLFNWKDEVVKKLTGGLKLLTKSRNIVYIQGYASFTSNNTLTVKTGRNKKSKVNFEYAIIATGSVPIAIPGIDLDTRNVLSSKTALSLNKVPKNMLIVGGGYIGLELGTVYSALGTEITVVEMLDSLIQGADKDLVNILNKRLKKDFKSILLSTKLNELKELKTKVKVLLETKEKIDEYEFEKVLISIGRKPNTDKLDLKNTNVEVDEKGFIKVDNQRRTAEKNIFAIGDVAGEPMLAHKATYEGKIVSEVINGEKSTYDPAAIPAIIFTDPEIAWCGITENYARDNKIDVEISKFPWAASGRALTLNRTDGMTKVIVDKSTKRVHGVGIVGPGAGELISEAVLAIEMAATAEDIAFTIHPHPTLTETFMEAAEGIYGNPTHQIKIKKAN